MRVDRLRELLMAIQRDDWTEVMTIAQEAAEQKKTTQRDATRYPTLTECERWYEQTDKPFG